ncbi:hypothetical protein AURDEDRAFT_171018 [Auricularia subglabra TFB-10046 SS5]|nr:hypothetical protein AURDEDRAFT_171018 [Auricularia subglabra TFB-10046 SS5]
MSGSVPVPALAPAEIVGDGRNVAHSACHGACPSSRPRAHRRARLALHMPPPVVRQNSTHGFGFSAGGPGSGFKNPMDSFNTGGSRPSSISAGPSSGTSPDLSYLGRLHTRLVLSLTIPASRANIDMVNMFDCVTALAVALHLHYPNASNYAPSPPQQRPLWAASLPPYVIPSVAGPSTLRKCARHSAPNSPTVPSSSEKPRLESALGHGARARRIAAKVDLLPEPIVSIDKSFASKTPPRTEANTAPVPVPETSLTAAYGAMLAALFCGPREEDIPEEECSPEKKTLYGTERSNDTRIGEFGWG